MKNRWLYTKRELNYEEELLKRNLKRAAAVVIETNTISLKHLVLDLLRGYYPATYREFERITAKEEL